MRKATAVAMVMMAPSSILREVKIPMGRLRKDLSREGEPDGVCDEGLSFRLMGCVFGCAPARLPPRPPACLSEL